MVRYVKTNGLFNFLCYLQKFDKVTMEPTTKSKFAKPVKYQQCVRENGEFFIDNSIDPITRGTMKKNLIEDYYELLNTKKLQEHNLKKEFHNSRARMEMTQEELHKP